MAKQLTNPALANLITSAKEQNAPAAKTQQSKTAESQQQDLWLIRENKSQRVQLLLQPSIVAKGKEAAAGLGISFNEYVNRAIITMLTTPEDEED